MKKLNDCIYNVYIANIFIIYTNKNYFNLQTR